ncbi:MAG: addiction module protein [Coriobacteriia bacterium]|nr:addiction module protein [Coriobacteriia bacterium]
MGDSPIDISSLSASERIQLAQDLWDSVVAADADIPLTPAQMQELDRRLDDASAHPDASVPWDTVRARLEGQIRRGR